MFLENGHFCTRGGPLMVKGTLYSVIKGRLRWVECSSGFYRPITFELDEKICTKVVLENGHFCTRGGPLIVKVTLYCGIKGRLRLAGCRSGFYRPITTELDEKICTKVAFENGRFCTRGGPLIVKVTL